jgi:hypothetical protein
MTYYDAVGDLYIGTLTTDTVSFGRKGLGSSAGAITIKFNDINTVNFTATTVTGLQANMPVPTGGVPGSIVYNGTVATHANQPAVHTTFYYSSGVLHVPYVQLTGASNTGAAYAPDGSSATPSYKLAANHGLYYDNTANGGLVLLSGSSVPRSYIYHVIPSGALGPTKVNTDANIIDIALGAQDNIKANLIIDYSIEITSSSPAATFTAAGTVLVSAVRGTTSTAKASISYVPAAISATATINTNNTQPITTLTNDTFTVSWSAVALVGTSAVNIKMKANLGGLYSTAAVTSLTGAIAVRNLGSSGAISFPTA